jgi:hypothetical protein
MLRREDFHTGTWQRYETQLQARLAELRAENDGITKTPEQTLILRGRIDEIKRALDLRKRSSGAGAEPSEAWPLTSAETPE